MSLGELQQLTMLAVARLDSEAYGASIRDELLTIAARKVSVPTGVVAGRGHVVESQYVLHLVTGQVLGHGAGANPVAGNVGRAHAQEDRCSRR